MPTTRSPGRLFADYELLEEIARGGMGVVYKARQLKLNRVVALKMILAGQLASDEDVRRFHTEAEAAAKLDHPGIVPIYEVGEHAGQHYFSMGFVQGSTLDEVLAAGPLPAREAAEVTAGIAEAVGFAHAHGVVHRDLKPGNVLIDNDGHPRITDFGLAKHIDADGDLTTTGQILGTPSFMSPEQAAGNVREVTEATDVYAIGATLYALLVGHPPFRADNQLDTLMRVVEEEPESPRAANAKIPRDLETICLKCLAKDARYRYRNAQDLADELWRFLDGEPILAKRMGPLRRLGRWCRTRPALAVTVAALAVFYLIHLVCIFLLKLPGEGGTFHYFVTTLLIAWVAGAYAFQHLMVRFGWQEVVPYGWSVMDVLMLTLFLLVARGATSPMAIGYLLLVAGSALRFRIGLVWVVCVMSIVGYSLLQIDAHWYRPDFKTPLHTPLYYVLSLVILAGIMHLLLRRVRAMPSEQAGTSSGSRRSRHSARGRSAAKR